MPGNTINLNLPYPLGNETADPQRDIKLLAEAIDEVVETPGTWKKLRQMLTWQKTLV
jgi:hypothetical protein